MPKKIDKVVEVDFKKPNKPKQIKELNITLDPGTDGKRIKDLNYYYNINPERMVTTDDAVLLLAGLCSKSTLEKSRKFNPDDAGERGPQYRKISARVVKYKVLWLMRYREGLSWIKEETELKHHYTVTASNIPQATLKSFSEK